MIILGMDDRIFLKFDMIGNTSIMVLYNWYQLEKGGLKIPQNVE